MRVMTAQAFMKAALENENGYYMTFVDRESAERMRMSCYQYRGRMRKRNEKLFLDEPGYVPYTEYDALKFDLREEGIAWVLIATQIDMFLETTKHGPLPDGWRSGQPIAPVDEA